MSMLEPPPDGAAGESGFRALDRPPWWAHAGVWVLLIFTVAVVALVLLFNSATAGAAGGCGGG